MRSNLAIETIRQDIISCLPNKEIASKHGFSIGRVKHYYKIIWREYLSAPRPRNIIEGFEKEAENMYERERHPQYTMNEMGKDIESCFRDGWMATQRVLVKHQILLRYGGHSYTMTALNSLLNNNHQYDEPHKRNI